jgi:hypothetical protein
MAHLHILWTNGDELTFDKMVAMYSRNAMIYHWWEEITLVIWGSPAKLAAESELVAQRIGELIQVGVKVSACKACTDALGVSEKLSEMGVEIKYWGEGLTEILKAGKHLLTI